jgi:hypothetical protein
MKTHTVVTFYKKGSAVVQHAYGPFTPQKAWRVRKQFITDFEDEVKAGRLFVSAVKTLDETVVEDLRTY